MARQTSCKWRLCHPPSLTFGIALRHDGNDLQRAKPSGGLSQGAGSFPTPACSLLIQPSLLLLPQLSECKVDRRQMPPLQCDAWIFGENILVGCTANCCSEQHRYVVCFPCFASARRPRTLLILIFWTVALAK